MKKVTIEYLDYESMNSGRIEITCQTFEQVSSDIVRINGAVMAFPNGIAGIDIENINDNNASAETGELKLMELVDVETSISWWTENREKLNEVIQSFNDLQTKHRFDRYEFQIVRAKIKSLRKYGEEHSFADWQFQMLDEMEDFLCTKEVEFKNSVASR